MKGKWNMLPEDLVKSIEEVVVRYDDKVRFRAVSTWWNNSTSNLKKLPNKLPCLLFNHDLDEDICKDATHGFINVNGSTNTYHMYIPEAQGKMYKGSSYGYIAIVDDTDAASPDIYLLNPLTRSKIPLPPRNKFPGVKKYCPNKVGNEYGLVYGPRDRDSMIVYVDAARVNKLMWKIILSAPPSERDCVAVAIYNRQDLAYCDISRNKKWNAIDNSFAYSDAIFHKGKLHAVTSNGSLMVFESVISNPVTIVGTRFRFISHLYLVESFDGDKLFMVNRTSTCHSIEGFIDHTYWPWKTTGFKVYMHDKTIQSWVLLQSIGNSMLFLGVNVSLSLSSRDFPGCKSNRIYFTDDHIERQWKHIKGSLDMGVFDLLDKTITPLPGYKPDPYRLWPPPVWVTPTL